MVVAGYFLVEGLSQFSGSDSARRMLIVGGVLFQVTESICFISASALTYHTVRWRYILFTLGLVLFSFSIAVMTIAQKTALQTGEAEASAIDEKRDYIRKQIASLQEVISSYRFNAEKQSRSIYKDSRAMGQDSINRAAQMEEKKIALSEELFTLNAARRQTSSDFFARFEEITGLPQKNTEFYFLVIRSLLLELCGIILMSFGANLRAYNKLVSDIEKTQSSGSSSNTAEAGLTSDSTKENNSPVAPLNEVLVARDIASKNTAQIDVHPSAPDISTAKNSSGPVTFPKSTSLPQPEQMTEPKRMPKSVPHQKVSQKPVSSYSENQAVEDSSHLDAQQLDHSAENGQSLLTLEKDDGKGRGSQNGDLPEYWASPKIREQHLKNQADVTDNQLLMLSNMVTDLLEQNLIPNLNEAAIRKGLSEHCTQTVSTDTAAMLSQILMSRQDDMC